MAMVSTKMLVLVIFIVLASLYEIGHCRRRRQRLCKTLNNQCEDVMEVKSRFSKSPFRIGKCVSRGGVCTKKRKRCECVFARRIFNKIGI